MDIRTPDFSFEWKHYLRRPWRLRWRFKPLPLHYGKEFREYRCLLAQSINWTSEQIDAYQWQKLKLILKHAYQTTTFYHEQFDSLKITPDDIRSLSDFTQLPIISRQDLRDNIKAFISTEFKKHRGSEAFTSGTTGNVLKFYRSWDVESMRKAVEWRHHNLIGYSFKQPRAKLSVPFMGNDSNLLYKYDPLENTLYINGVLINMEYGRQIYDLLQRFNPVMIYAYPSGATSLATVIKRHGLDPLKIPVIKVESEMLDKFNLKRIQSYLGRRVYDHYGNRENTISASQLRCGNYHINSEFAYMELVPNNNKTMGESYSKVVGTSLTNYAMPLIRYDSDDLGTEITGCDNHDCKIIHPTIRFIGGREKDFIVTRDGLLYCLFDDEIVYEGLDFLEEYQIVQEDLDNLTLKVVTASNFQKEQDEPRLMDLFRRTTRDLFKLSLEYVDNIPRTKGWKKSRVVSKLAQRDLADD